MTTDPQFPPRDRLFALIASIPGSGTFDWCTPARALLDEIATPSAAVSPPPATDRAGLRGVLADAIRAAACPGDACPLSEADCAEQRIQPGVWERGVLAEVSGRPEWFADAVLAVLPTDDRRAAILEAADAVARFTGNELDANAKMLRRLAAGEWDERQARQDGAETRPARGDQFEAWLKAQRDEYEVESSPQWGALDEVLDTYRLHADTGTPLDQHACEGRTVGDCECLEPHLTPSGNVRVDHLLHQPAAAPVAGQPPADTGEEPMFSVPGCTCRPFTRQGGVGRYLEPHETVDKVGGWEIAADCPHHKRSSKEA